MPQLILVLKRLTVWLVEMVIITALWTLAIGLLFRTSTTSFHLSELRFSIVIVMFFMLAYGFTFPFSTAVARALVKTEQLWVYPAVATLLFGTSFVLAAVIGGSFPKLDYSLGAVCAVIVLVCTLGGNLLLRRWTSDPR